MDFEWILSEHSNSDPIQTDLDSCPRSTDPPPYAPMSHAASVTTPPEPPRLRLYTKSPDPKGHSSFLAIKDKEDVDRDETVDNAAAQALEVANKAQTPAQAIAALQTGLTTEAARDRPPSQRMPRPAAAKSALKRPASSLQ